MNSKEIAERKYFMTVLKISKLQGFVWKTMQACFSHANVSNFRRPLQSLLLRYTVQHENSAGSNFCEFCVDLWIDLDPQKLVPAEKKIPQNKTPQKLTPLSQIKNSAFNGLVVYGRDRLLFCFAVVQSLCAVRYCSDYRIILH